MQLIHNDLTRREIVPLEACLSYLLPVGENGKLRLTGFTFLVGRQQGQTQALILNQFLVLPQTALEFVRLEDFKQAAALQPGEPVPNLIENLTPPAVFKERGGMEQELYSLCEKWVKRGKPVKAKSPAVVRFLENLEQLSPPELMRYYQFCAPECFG